MSPGVLPFSVVLVRGWRQGAGGQPRPLLHRPDHHLRQAKQVQKQVQLQRWGSEKAPHLAPPQRSAPPSEVRHIRRMISCLYWLTNSN